MRLFRNGSLVKVWRGDVLKGQTSVTLEANIAIVAGENRLAAYAFNRDNVKSKDATLNLTGASSLKRPGTAYVLAIGVNAYSNPQYNLKYAVADAAAFGEEVRRAQQQIANYEHVEVASLLDEQATKANILRALRRLAGTAGRLRPPMLLRHLKSLRPPNRKMQSSSTSRDTEPLMGSGFIYCRTTWATLASELRLTLRVCN